MCGAGPGWQSVDLVTHVNSLHWDGPLRGWLTCIAHYTGPTEIEIAVGLGDDPPVVWTITKPDRANCDDAAALTKQIVIAAQPLVARAVEQLLRRGPKLELREPSLADLLERERLVEHELERALGRRDWLAPKDGVIELANQRNAAINSLDMVAPRPWEASIDDAESDPEDDPDNREWVVDDANGNEIDRSLGYNDEPNGVWARGLVAEVNALPHLALTDAGWVPVRESEAASC